MMQYIGARYVPIFYENSQDPTSSLWENNVTYEPLTWVELANGHMYISKKTVPTSIGSPVDNPEYWLEAGQYNAYIQSLQDQIDDMKDGDVTGSLQNQINTLSDTDTSLQNQINDMNDGSVSGSLQDQINDMKDGSVSGSLQDQINDMKDGSVSGSLQDQINDMKDGSIAGSLQNQIDIINNIDDDSLIFIGDSYGVDASVGGTSWATLMASVYPNAAYLIMGGTSFASDVYITANFLSMLTAHVNTLTADQKKKIKQVIVIGGANDAQLVYNGSTDTTTVSTRIINFCSYVAANLPNAKVKCAFVGWFRNNVKHDAYNSVRDIYNSMRIKNYAYYSEGEPIMRINSQIENVDRIHPNSQSSYNLASFVANVVTDGRYHFARNGIVSYTAISGLSPQPTVDNIGTIQCWVDGNDANITILGVEGNYGFWRVNFPAGTNVAPGQSGRFLTLNGVPIGGANPEMCTIPVAIYGDGSVYKGTYPISIAIQENELVWRYMGHETVNWRSAQFPMCSWSMNLRHS